MKYNRFIFSFHNNSTWNRTWLCYIVCIAILFFSCKKEQKLYELMASSETGITFSNQVNEDDVKYNVEQYMNIYTGAGVAAGDINNDGLTDLYFSGNQNSGKLYLNKGNFKFEDITELAGVTTDRWCTGVTMADVNQDGLLDIYINVAGGKSYGKHENLLFINNGNLKFTESAEKYGIAEKRLTMNSSFLDYDGDGDLDLFLATNPADDNRGGVNSIRENSNSSYDSTQADILYRNNGNNTFTDVSKQAGIIYSGYSLGVAVSDINNDGRPDIYVCNDFLANDILYINNGDGTFTNRLKDYLKHSSFASMGMDVGDFNNDGRPDIFTLDMLPEDNYRRKMLIANPNYDWYRMTTAAGYLPQYTRNNLQLNNGDSTFSEIGFMAGVSSTDWSWSALWGDYDNDGDKDLMITNGFYRDMGNRDYIMNQSRSIGFNGQRTNTSKDRLKEVRSLTSFPLQNYIFRNNNDLSFTKTSDEWGLIEKGFSSGACYADLDNDGDLELIVNCFNSKAKIYKNNAEQLVKNNFLTITLKGDAPNLQGIGAKIWIHCKDTVQYQEFSPYRGYESSMEYRLHFGLGKNSYADSLIVIWPDGNKEIQYKLLANKSIELYHKKANSPTENSKLSAVRSDLPFSNISGQPGLNYIHIEDSDFNDFNLQFLLPHMFSKNGPGIAVGDINNDKLDDFYIGAGAGQEGSFFIQSGNGKFSSMPLSYDKVSEDMGVLLFDADNDRDLDLYVVSGGSQTELNAPAQQDRLYENDGNGNFKPFATPLPDTKSSGSCVIAADYDNDGDLDLFVGGRVSPGSYPLAPRSYLLRNDTRQGQPAHFTDVTVSVCPDLVKPGMVTSALWTDYDNDGKPDLAICGEFMPLLFFHNNGKTFTKNPTSNQQSNSGWWNNIVSGDFDEDGDIDYIAGNLGMNTPLKASMDQPLCIYAKDFDHDGRIDPIMCFFNGDKNYIYPLRDEVIKQMNYLRSRFYTFDDYARISFEEAFTKEEMTSVQIVKASCFQTSYFENKGNGIFERKGLPFACQVAPVFGMLVQDFSGDGHLDVLMTGNSYSNETSIGRLDAMNGLLLTGNGKGGFEVDNADKSGFKADKDAKGIANLFLADGSEVILVGNNSAELGVYKSNRKIFRTIDLENDIHYLNVTLKNGGTYRQEIYRGNSYLSQGSAKFLITPEMSSISYKDGEGKIQTIEFSP